MTKAILVTGGAGFIGSHVVAELLRKGYKITVLDNFSTGLLENIQGQDVQLIEGDILDFDAVLGAMQDVDLCIHCAAVASVGQSLSEPNLVHCVNSVGTVNVFRAASEVNSHKVPVIYASSAAVYGNSDELPLTETARTKPISPYGLDKLVNETYAEMMQGTHGLATIGLRFFNVYGPRQRVESDYAGVISIFSKLALENQSISIYGDGSQTRDFIHVQDIAQIIGRLCDNPINGAEVYNVCTGQSTSVKEISEIILRYSTNKDILYKEKKNSDIMDSCGSCKKLLDKIGDFDFHPFEYGIDDLMQTLKKN